MNIDIEDYDVFPGVVRSGEESRITITPKQDSAAFDDSMFYTVRFIPMECNHSDYRLDCFEGNFDTRSVKPINGAIMVQYSFLEEQEWSLEVTDGQRNTGVFHIYSLFSDLFAKRPYKGDLHVHSNRSDGREEPGIVAANYRKAGFDFMAITDHHRWRPSLEAIENYRNVKIDLRLFPGEEVHVPGNYIHVINFGGRYSVNELYENNKAEIDGELEERAKAVSVPEGINALEYCYRDWIAGEIRKGGGLSILVHPFWIWCNEYNMQTKMTVYLFETNCFDAFELLGGQSVKENNLQTALYEDQLANGRKIPIVGSSDSHGTEPPVWFDTVKTILFSENLEFGNITRNIKAFNSVAVETREKEIYRVNGPFRIMKYAMFLLEHYFPKHDELCVREGTLMKDYVCGKKEAKAPLEELSGQTKRFEKQFFGC